MTFAEKIAEKIKIAGDAVFQQSVSGNSSATFAVKVDNSMFKDILNKTNMSFAEKMMYRVHHFFSKKPVEVTVSRDNYGNQSVGMSIDGFRSNMSEKEQQALADTFTSPVAAYVNEGLIKQEHQTAAEIFGNIQFFKDSARMGSHGANIDFEVNGDAKKILDARTFKGENSNELGEKYTATIGSSGEVSVTKTSKEFTEYGTVEVSMQAVPLTQEEKMYLRNEITDYARTVMQENRQHQTESQPEYQPEKQPEQQKTAVQEYSESKAVSEPAPARQVSVDR